MLIFKGTGHDGQNKLYRKIIGHGDFVIFMNNPISITDEIF